MIAKTPTPPYYAVIFTSTRTVDDNEYSKTADRMVELAKQQNGFLGVESVRDEIGITVSYWRDLKAIKSWKENAEHSIVREKGKTEWYKAFNTSLTII